MFSEKEIIKLRQLCQEIIANPLPIDRQEAVMRDGYIWCCDWWAIEVLKCLFLGEVDYRRDPLPRRLKNNPMFSLENTVTDVNCKIAMHRILSENKNFSKKIVVCEIGRGIDLLLANFVNPEAEYIVYDANPHMVEKVRQYFVGRLGLNVTLQAIPSQDFEFPKDKPLTVLLNHNRGVTTNKWYVDKDWDSTLFILDGVSQCQVKA